MASTKSMHWNYYWNSFNVYSYSARSNFDVSIHRFNRQNLSKPLQLKYKLPFSPINLFLGGFRPQHQNSSKLSKSKYLHIFATNNFHDWGNTGNLWLTGCQGTFTVSYTQALWRLSESSLSESSLKTLQKEAPPKLSENSLKGLQKLPESSLKESSPWALRKLSVSSLKTFWKQALLKQTDFPWKIYKSLSKS